MPSSDNDELWKSSFFDFVEGLYFKNAKESKEKLKQKHSKTTIKIKTELIKKESKLTYPNEINAISFPNSMLGNLIFFYYFVS